MVLKKGEEIAKLILGCGLRKMPIFINLEPIMNKKQAYEERLQAQLEEFNAKINILKTKVSKADPSVQLSYYETIEKLSLRRELAKSKLNELKNAEDETWEELKDGMEKAWSDLSAAIRAATARLK